MPPKKNFLSSFIAWFQVKVLGKKPQPVALKEALERPLTESDFFRYQKYMGMLNRVQQVTTNACLMWKLIPLTNDHAFFYYVVCFEVPYESQSLTSISISTGGRQFVLRRSQGKSWGKHQIQIIKAERRSDNWRLVYSRNVSFLGRNLQLEPNFNAATAMKILARRLLTVALHKLDDPSKWDHQVKLAIDGWGEVEQGKPLNSEEYWNLDKK
jgi:hypothetical protein